MRDRSDADLAAAIAAIDQRQAALRDVREVAEQSTQALVDALVDAIRAAHDESFEEVARQLREEEASVLQHERE